jgi:hypothetical protein
LSAWWQRYQKDRRGVVSEITQTVESTVRSMIHAK